jgi:hypothetical protein
MRRKQRMRMGLKKREMQNNHHEDQGNKNATKQNTTPTGHRRSLCMIARISTSAPSYRVEVSQ